jgi:hypothetical protein
MGHQEVPGKCAAAFAEGRGRQPNASAMKTFGANTLLWRLMG